MYAHDVCLQVAAVPRNAGFSPRVFVVIAPFPLSPAPEPRDCSRARSAGVLRPGPHDAVPVRRTPAVAAAWTALEFGFPIGSPFVCAPACTMRAVRVKTFVDQLAPPLRPRAVRIQRPSALAPVLMVLRQRRPLAGPRSACADAFIVGHLRHQWRVVSTGGSAPSG